METSTNFSFNLPSRDNDDIADINQISDNFRIIDEKLAIDQTFSETSENPQSGTAIAGVLSGYVPAEVGKGLSSNDFTDEDKKKLYSALQDEDIDQTYNPESANAQSGTAIAEVLSGYVSAEVGKGLSSNDYTDEEKEKLAGIEEGAEVNAPVDTTYNPESANAQSGIAVAQAIDTCSPAIVITSDTAKTLSIPDSSESAIKGLTAYGESTQDGTPTTDSPVEIESVENPVISVYGKNLIPATEISQTVNGITFTSLGDGTITMNGTSTATASIIIPFQSSLHSGTYTLSFNNSEALGNNNVYALIRDDLGAFENFILYANLANATKTTTINQDKTNIMFIVLAGTTLNSFTIRPQLEVGSVATPYEPYIEPQTVTVPYTFAEGDRLILNNGIVKVNISGEETDITATETGQALLALKTNYPTTSVISDIDLDITYKADTKNYIDNKIAALTALTLEG